MSCGLGHLITGSSLGFDWWAIENPDFKPDDGNPWIYREEFPMIQKMNAEELEKMKQMKLAFPGAKVTDFRLPGARSPFPWVETYTEGEVKAMLKWQSEHKYTKDRGTYYESDKRENGIFGDTTFRRMCRALDIENTWHSKKTGPDPLDFTVGNWLIDVKTQTGASYWDDYELWILKSQLEDEKSVVNTYSFAQWDPEARRCTLLGWRLRKDIKPPLATFVEAGSDVWRPNGKSWTAQKDNWVIRVRDTNSEARFKINYPGRID